MKPKLDESEKKDQERKKKKRFSGHSISNIGTGWLLVSKREFGFIIILSRQQY